MKFSITLLSALLAVTVSAGPIAIQHGENTAFAVTRRGTFPVIYEAVQHIR